MEKYENDKSKTGIKLFWDEIPFKINGKKNLSSWESNLFKECKTNKRIFYLRKENKHATSFSEKEAHISSVRICL